MLKKKTLKIEGGRNDYQNESPLDKHQNIIVFWETQCQKLAGGNEMTAPLFS